MTARSRSVLETGRIRLRPTTEDDLEFVMSLERDPENAPFILRWPVDDHLTAISDPDRAHLMVEAKDTGRDIGYVILAALQSPHRSIEFVRITVARKGEGYGRECLRAIKRMAFDSLGAQRLWLDVMSHNARARSLYLAEGFVEEGTLRQSVELDGRRVSLIVLSMLEHEFRQEQERAG
ncbi:MAG TPA: GNAT family protein [Gammaproteobacteria bacterium]|nr:GNAT family protein [Gammaproteobacteria bacterium]